MDLETSTSGAIDASAPSQAEGIDSNNSTPQDSLPEIYEIEKLPKFKFQGQELTARDLEKMVLFQKDYTTKTQKIAEERKEYAAKLAEVKKDEEFRENLDIDLKHVRNNPQLAAKFLQVYPAKYHSALQKVLSELGVQQQGQNTPNYEMLTLQQKVQEMESVFNEQKISVENMRINSTIDQMSKKYDDALPEVVLTRVLEAHSQMIKENPSAKITPQMWEEAFRTQDAEMKNLVKTKYASKVKQQLEANQRGRDVPTGGASMGRAPQKFKSLSDVTKHAVRQLSQRG